MRYSGDRWITAVACLVAMCGCGLNHQGEPDSAGGYGSGRKKKTPSHRLSKAVFDVLRKKDLSRVRRLMPPFKDSRGKAKLVAWTTEHCLGMEIAHVRDTAAGQGFDWMKAHLVKTLFFPAEPSKSENPDAAKERDRMLLRIRLRESLLKTIEEEPEHQRPKLAPFTVDGIKKYLVPLAEADERKGPLFMFVQDGRTELVMRIETNLYRGKRYLANVKVFTISRIK